MAYVTIPKDLSRIQSKVLFGLTKRQVICFGAAALVGVPHPEGPESDTEQGPVRADQTTSDLFRSGGAGRRAAFLFGKGEPGNYHGGAVHDPGDAALFPVRHV